MGGYRNTDLLGRFRTEVGQGGQLELVQLFLHQQGSYRRDGFTISELGKSEEKIKDNTKVLLEEHV